MATETPLHTIMTPKIMPIHEHQSSPRRGSQDHPCVYCYKYPSMALRFQCIICSVEACRFCLEKQQIALPSSSQPAPPTGPTRTEVIELRILQLENEVYKLTQKVEQLEQRSSHTPEHLLFYENADYIEESSSKTQIEFLPWTAFTCPLGSFEWLVMPFGLKTAPAVFQRKMDEVFKPYQNFVCVYIDDILVHSKSEKEHTSHLKLVLQKFYIDQQFEAYQNNRLQILRPQLLYRTGPLNLRTQLLRITREEHLSVTTEPRNLKIISRDSLNKVRLLSMKLMVISTIFFWKIAFVFCCLGSSLYFPVLLW